MSSENSILFEFLVSKEIAHFSAYGKPLRKKFGIIVNRRNSPFKI